MFYYLIYNSTIIKKENNKNVSTLIYGTIIYIVIHAFINFNKTLKENLIRYFWLFFSVDIVSVFLTSDISTDIQKHNFLDDIKPRTEIKKKKKSKPQPEIQVEIKEDIGYEKPRKSNNLKEILKKKNKKLRQNIVPENNLDIEETQNILNEIEIDNDTENDNERVTKKVTFNIPDDARSEISDNSDLDIDLESFEKSLLED